MTGVVLEQTSSTGLKITSRVVTTYTDENGQVLPTRTTVFATGDQEAQHTDYQYDDHNNIVEALGPDGVPTAYIWGYNQTLPVAKVVGATRSQVNGRLGADFQAGAGSLSDAQAQTLRNGLPSAQVTVYTYDPLVGITSETDPNGRTMTYHYDELNRLEWIESEEGHVVQKFDYQYADITIVDPDPDPDPEPCSTTLRATISGSNRASINNYTTFRVQATGCAPFTYRWSTDGQMAPNTSRASETQVRWSDCGLAEVNVTVRDSEGRSLTVSKSLEVDDPIGNLCDGEAPVSRPEDPTNTENN